MAGITCNQNALARDDTLFSEIEEIRLEVFGKDDMGYVEPEEDSEDPFASDSSDSDISDVEND